MFVFLATMIGVLFTAGLWLILRAQAFQVCLGLTLISYATNLFIFCSARLKINAIPILQNHISVMLNPVDPVPQSLVLTAIVINFAMTALSIVVLIIVRGFTKSDHVDGEDHRHE